MKLVCKHWLEAIAVAVPLALSGVALAQTGAGEPTGPAGPDTSAISATSHSGPSTMSAGESNGTAKSGRGASGLYAPVTIGSDMSGDTTDIAAPGRRSRNEHPYSDSGTLHGRGAGATSGKGGSQ